MSDFFSSLGTRDLPTGAGALVGIILLFLMFKTGKILTKCILFVTAVALFVGACLWHLHNHPM